MTETVTQLASTTTAVQFAAADGIDPLQL